MAREEEPTLVSHPHAEPPTRSMTVLVETAQFDYLLKEAQIQRRSLSAQVRQVLADWMMAAEKAPEKT